MPILTKRERQDAKLTLADTDRRARNLIEPGRYIDVSADATQLPTRYAVGDNNTNNLVINPNISGLLPGRPWNSTTSVYAILAFEPKLVFDFTGNVFKTGGGISTFSNSITHARAGNATMVDSDGLLKWAPHNLVPYSEDQTQWYLYPATATRTADRITFTTATTDRRAATYSDGIQTVGGLDYKIVADFTVDDGLPVIALGTRSGLYKFAWASYDTTLLTSDDYSVSDTVTNITVDSCVNISGNIWRLTVGYTAGSSVPTAVIVHLGTAGQTASQLRTAGVGTGSCGVTNVHSFRSDLGGMVNNPTTSNSYVPTTSSAVYAPRVGHHVYNGSAWVNEGILHESEARTNLVTYSNDFTHSSWVKNATITPNDAVSPDGTSNASKFSFGGTGYFQFNHSRTTGQTYTISAWVKSYDGTDEAFQLYAQNGAFNQDFIATSEWQRFSFTYTSTGTTFNGDGIARPTNNIPALLHVYGIQIEAGSTPSSYIPTSGSTVTRAAETLTVPAANLPYSSTNVSIQIDGKMTYADDGATTFFYRWLLNPTNYAQTVLQTTGSYEGRIRSSQRETTSGYDEVATSNSYFTPDINVPFNISSRHGSTFLNAAEGGTALTANTTVTALPDLSSADLLLGSIFMGTIGKFRVWDEDLTDAGIVEATEPSTEPSLQLTFDSSSTNSFTVLDWSE